MKYKKKENLNERPYWKFAYGKRKTLKGHGNFHHRGDIKLVGKENDMQECKECHRSCGHYECPKCGCEYHLPCKKYPGHMTSNKCPECGKGR